MRQNGRCGCSTSRRTIEPLRRAGADRVGIYFLTKAGAAAYVQAEHTYVHAKVCIVDDLTATIGSVNWNRRSLTHDSEVIAIITDPTGDFAKQLRTRLWAEHLAVEEPEDLNDWRSAAQRWESPGPHARIARYDENSGIDASHLDGMWNTTWNPDGS